MSCFSKKRWKFQFYCRNSEQGQLIQNIKAKSKWVFPPFLFYVNYSNFSRGKQKLTFTDQSSFRPSIMSTISLNEILIVNSGLCADTFGTE